MALGVSAAKSEVLMVTLRTTAIKHFELVTNVSEAHASLE